MQGSQVSCGLPLFLEFLPIRPKRIPRGRVAAHVWYQEPLEESPHPGVSPNKHARATAHRSNPSPAQHGEDRTRLRRGAKPGTVGPILNRANPCGNFSGTSSLKFRGTKGSIGHTFMVCIHTENQNQGDFYPFVLLEISVLNESPLGHLRYLLTDVPPQPNSPPDNVIGPGQAAKAFKARKRAFTPSPASPNK